MERLGLIKKLGEGLGKVWLGIAFVLVAGLAYEAGSIWQALDEPEPVIIEVPSQVPEPALPVHLTKVVSEPSAAGEKPSGEECAFVGSRNSNKYHIPSSRCAKQIKTENRLCFASTEAATARGYVPGCLE